MAEIENVPGAPAGAAKDVLGSGEQAIGWSEQERRVEDQDVAPEERPEEGAAHCSPGGMGTAATSAGAAAFALSGGCRNRRWRPTWRLRACSLFRPKKKGFRTCSLKQWPPASRSAHLMSAG